MTITLTWEDLVQLGNNRTLAKDGATITLGKELFPSFSFALNGPVGSSVLFTVDDLSAPKDSALASDVE